LGANRDGVSSRPDADPDASDPSPSPATSFLALQGGEPGKERPFIIESEYTNV
jgi:hypothetical protein